MTSVAVTMASDSSRDTTPVLCFNPRPHKAYSRPRYLLWPAHVYRVLAPQVRDWQLNTFQKAVLGLCQAGESNAEGIADLLAIDPDLALLILEELAGKGYIDEQDRITARGESALQEDRGDHPDLDSLVVGYVFQDPWSGRLWPRFVEQLRFAETRYQDDSPWPRLVLGSRGKPCHHRPWVVRFRDRTPPELLTAGDILKAVYRHRQALRTSRYTVIDEDDSDPDHADLGLWAPHVDRVSLISALPQLHYLTSRLYLPSKESLDYQDWYAADPFGLGPSPFLRRQISQQIEKDKWLKDFLVSLTEPFENDFRSNQELIEDEVRRKVRVTLRYDTLYCQLAQMEGADQDASSERVRQDRLDDVVIKAAKVLERLFYCIWREYPPDSSCDAFLTADLPFREGLLNAVADQLGYQVPLPPNITRVKPGGVRWAAQNGRGTLGQRAAVALLTARVAPHHPLQMVTSVLPDLFERLGELISCRNLAAHDTPESVSREAVIEQVENVYRIAQVLAS